MPSSSCSQAHILVHKLTLSLTHSLNNNPHHSDIFLKLRGRKIVVGPSFFFLNVDDVVSYKDEERSCHIMKR